MEEQIKSLAVLKAERPEDCFESRDAIIKLIQETVYADLDKQDDGDSASVFQESLRLVLGLTRLGFDDVYLQAKFLTATPAQLSEALLRATGKWKD